METEITAQGSRHPGMQASVRLTSEIMNMVRARSGNVRLVAFSGDEEVLYYEAFQRISRENGIEFIEGIPQALQQAELNGIAIKAADEVHWNEAGHRVIADRIANYLKQHGIIAKAS